MSNLFPTITTHVSLAARRSRVTFTAACSHGWYEMPSTLASLYTRRKDARSSMPNTMNTTCWSRSVFCGSVVNRS